MKKTTAVLAALMLVCVLSGCGSTERKDAGGGTGAVYISAFQSADSGVESEGGRGWVELRVGDAAKLSDDWAVYTAYSSEWKSRLCSAADLARLSWHLESGSIIRLHPQPGYTGPDDAQTADCGNDGKYDLCYDTGSPGIYAPDASCGSVWVEDCGAVTDFSAFLNGSDRSDFPCDLIDGTPSDGTRILRDAVSSGQWPSESALFVFDAASGYARLSDASKEGNLPSDWMTSSEPSVTYRPELQVQDPSVSPSTAAKGKDIVFSIKGSGVHGATIDSAVFDFSAVSFCPPDSSCARTRTVTEQTAGVYSCVLGTSEIVPGTYSVIVTVSGRGAESVQRRAAFSVVDKPAVAIGEPVFSFSPSTTAVFGKGFTVSVPSSAAATAVSSAILRCAALSLSAETFPDESGLCVWAVGPSAFPEGDYSLEFAVTGEGAEDAVKTVLLSVRSGEVVQGGDMESDIQSGVLNPSPGTGYIEASVSPEHVHSGSRSLHISGSAASNGFVFSTPASCARKAGFSRLVLYLKGEALGKSLSFNIFTDPTHYKIFNLGNISADAVILPSGSNSYTGSISAADWVKVSFDLTDVVPAGKIACKFGASGVYDLYLDDISYE